MLNYICLVKGKHQELEHLRGKYTKKNIIVIYALYYYRSFPRKLNLKQYKIKTSFDSLKGPKARNNKTACGFYFKIRGKFSVIHW